MTIQQLFYIFSCDLVQSHLLHQPANVLSNVLHWLKSCKVVYTFWEKLAPHPLHTVCWHFLTSYVDVFNTLQNVEWAAIILDSFVWPVQNAHHKAWWGNIVAIITTLLWLLPQGWNWQQICVMKHILSFQHSLFKFYCPRRSYAGLCMFTWQEFKCPC